MKKLLYLFLVLPLMFSSCSKDSESSSTPPTPTVVEGCTDSDATNYNSDATSDDGSCIYDVSGAVWAIMSATADGVNVMSSNIALYLWANGDFGWEEYDLDGTAMIDWGGGPGVGSWDTPGDNVIIVDDGDAVVINAVVSPMTDNDNMTWTTTSIDGGTVIMTLERTNWSLNDWK